MSRGRIIRLIVVIVLLASGFVYIQRTPLDPNRISLWITAVIGGVTTIYALFTFEILLQNESMARAAVASSTVMEQSLRFSHAPSLLYETLNTQDPTFQTREGLTAYPNEEYKRALAEYNQQQEGQRQKEFVFAVVHNMGRGAATNLSIEARYDITDSSNPNRDTSVTKQASVQTLEPGKTVALCVFIYKVPTSDDRAVLVSARLTASDFYREAINEPVKVTEVDVHKHHVEMDQGCVVRVT
jgi:hypothetical protein